MNVHSAPHHGTGDILLRCYPFRAGSIHYFSLFSGIGGFELGIERSLCDCPSISAANWPDAAASYSPHADGCERRYCASCVGFSEIDKYASQIYSKHFPSHQAYGDITKIDAEALPDFELLCGGFPCQAFSIAGKRRGFSDTRGTLFFEIARITAAKGPRLLFLENVKGLLSHDEGRTFYAIIETLDELGYDVQWQVLNSKDFGVPQNRERVFIVGHLRGTPRPEVFPFSGGSVENPVAYTLRVKADSGISSRHPRTLVEVSPPGTSDAQRIYDARGIGRTLKGESGGQGGKTGLYEIGSRIRRLTPIECERLQGFPDSWTAGISDTQRYKCLGNAVTVNVIEAIARRLLA